MVSCLVSFAVTHQQNTRLAHWRIVHSFHFHLRAATSERYCLPSRVPGLSTSLWRTLVACTRWTGGSLRHVLFFSRYDDVLGAFSLLRSCAGWSKTLCSCRIVLLGLQDSALGDADVDLHFALGHALTDDE